MKTRAPGSPSALRDLNRERAVTALRTNGQMTQADLVRVTGLSAATISTLVRELTTDGRVEVLEMPAGRRGRMLRLARERGLVIGIDLGHTHVRMALADLSRHVLSEVLRPLDVDSSPPDALNAIVALGHGLLADAGADPDEVLGLGLGVPGPIDASGVAVSSESILPGWYGTDIPAELKKRWDRPVLVENDANLGALGEFTWGAARGCSTAVYLTVGSGVGAGLVLDGKLFRGAEGSAGEIGHVSLDPNGQVCRCGNRGCFETVIGSGHLLRLLEQSHGRLTVDELLARAAEGDPGCRRVIADAGHAAGLAVGQLCNVLNPEVVVVGGQLATSGETFLGPLRQTAARMTAPSVAQKLRILPAELGARAEVLGAVVLVLSSPVASAHNGALAPVAASSAPTALDELATARQVAVR